MLLTHDELGRAEVSFADDPGPEAADHVLGAALEQAEAQGWPVLRWAAPVGAWGVRRAVHLRHGSYDGPRAGWLPGAGGGAAGGLADAWTGTLRGAGVTPEPWLDVPTLTGDGFRLRELTEADLPRVVEGSADPDTQHWLGHLPAPYTAADARAYLEARREQAASGAGVTWAVADPVDDRLLGTVLWFHLQPGVECEVGYWTHPQARGRGLATRAVQRVTDHVVGTLGVLRVTALAAAENTASCRVLERAGFRRCGTASYAAWVRAGRAEAALYEVTAADWSAGSSAGSSPGRSSRKATASTAAPASASSTPTTSGER